MARMGAPKGSDNLLHKDSWRQVNRKPLCGRRGVTLNHSIDLSAEPRRKGRRTMNLCHNRILGVSLVICLVGCATPERQSERKGIPLRGEVAANGIDFEYFIEGTEGRTCIVVGDALTPSRALSMQLREHFRFVFLNSRMTTPEERVGDVSSITMDTLVDDIEQARQALELGEVCVLGHSISGILVPLL